MPVRARLRIDLLRLDSGKCVNVCAPRTATLADGDEPRFLRSAHKFENVGGFESSLLRPTRVSAGPAVAVLKEFTRQCK